MITAHNLGLVREGDTVLDAVSFSLRAGEYVGLIGPNGAGKTTLIYLILGLIQPTSGTVEVDAAARIGYVPQQYGLSPVVPISVEEVLRMSGVKERSQFVLNLKKVGLESSFLTRNFHQLSGGQKQRVIIARALSHNPNVIIFDEPLTGVDFETKQKIHALLGDMNTRDGVTILFVSHEVEYVVGRCDHVLCLNKTLHRGCHPLDFAKGRLAHGAKSSPIPQVVPVHHHHDGSPSCPC